MSVLAAASTTFPVGSLFSSTANVAVPPDSVVTSRSVADVDGDTTIPAVSSSVRVRITFDGWATPLPPAAVPQTITDLSGESTSLPFAVTVTLPVLVVAPAAMVRVLAVLRAKSPDTAPIPHDAPTVTVTEPALVGCESVAVTIATPPVSVIDADDSTSDTVGRASSSSRVRVTSDGSATPLPPVAVPDTVTDLSGASVSLPFAVTVTEPVLAVDPAAMVRVVVPERVKSAATAPDPTAAATDTVTASLEGPDNLAVTVDTPPVSETDESESTSATVGRSSSSVSASAAPVTAPRPLARVAVTVAERPAEP